MDDLLDCDDTPAELAVEQKTLGNAAFKRGDLDTAVRCYSRAIELDPTTATFYSNRAAAYLRLHQPAAAVDDCTEALAVDPRNVKALARRGTAYVALGSPGDLASASADFEAALEVEPRNAQCLAALTAAYDEQIEAGGGGAALEHGVRVKRALLAGFAWRSPRVMGNPSPPPLTGHATCLTVPPPLSREGGADHPVPPGLLVTGGRAVRLGNSGVFHLSLSGGFADNDDAGEPQHWSVAETREMRKVAESRAGGSRVGGSRGGGGTSGAGRGSDSARSWHTMTHIGNAGDLVVVYGGILEQGGGETGDVAVLDVRHMSWCRVEWQGREDARPSPRSSHSATAITGGDVLVFGGRNRSGVMGDTHRLRVTRSGASRSGANVVSAAASDAAVDSTSVLEVAAAGTFTGEQCRGDVSTVVTLEWVPSHCPGRCPPGRDGHTATWCPSFDFTAITRATSTEKGGELGGGGGEGESTSPPPGKKSGGIESSGGETKTTQPGADGVDGADGAYSGEGGKGSHGSGVEGGLLVFGGNPQNAGEQRCDVWVLRASDMVWSELSPSGNAPGPRAYHTADRVGGLIIIHGGRSPQGSTGDVHVLDTVALAWHSVYVDARAILPRPLNNAAMKKAGLATSGTSNTSNTSGGAVMNTIAKRAWHSSQLVPFAATRYGGHGGAVAGGVEGAGGDAAGGGARKAEEAGGTPGGGTEKGTQRRRRWEILIFGGGGAKGPRDDVLVLDMTEAMGIYFGHGDTMVP